MNKQRSVEKEVFAFLDEYFCLNDRNVINFIFNFTKLLSAMFQNNPLLARLKQQLQSTTPRVIGTVKAHEKGFGFLESDNKKSYFIPTAKMKKLLHGDRIEGTITTQNGKEQFEPETIHESALSQFIGKIDYVEKKWVIYPYHPTIKVPIRCVINKIVNTKLEPGCWVSADLITRPFQANHQSFSAEITEFIAHDHDLLKLWWITLSRYQLPKTTPAATDTLVFPMEEEIQREDLTHLPFFSIDNSETKDIDDTFCICTTENNLFELTVAIADPSAYLSKGSPLDMTAKERLFTCYLPGMTVPMLPFEISENLCSLLPNTKRPAVICRLLINEQGCIVKMPEFKTAWICSHAKLSYDEVSDYLEQPNAKLDADDKITSQLTLLSQVAELRTAWRKKEAIIFKDQDDYKFIFDENKSVINVTKVKRRIAHAIVEEAMIAANLAFAQFIEAHLGYAIFNTHSGFDTKHLDTVLALLKENRINDYDKNRLISFEGYCSLRHEISGNTYLEERLMRYQTRADFSLFSAPHFGMGFHHYTTWTSPLRKYNDLVNHRLLKSVIRHSTAEKPDEEILHALALKRKQHRHAERDLSQALYSQFFSDKVGNVFEAVVMDVNKGGAKVRLTENGAFAFLPISLIHAKRNEIESYPQTGTIHVQSKPIFKTSDVIRVALHEIKSDSNTFIVKYHKVT